MVKTIQPTPVSIGNIVDLICIVTGVDPPNTITWSLNGTEVYSSNKATGGNISLTVSNADYIGEYTCRAVSYTHLTLPTNREV